MKKLEECNWKAFRIGDLFEIEPCKCSKVCEFHQGKVPYVGATNNNNGVLKFIENKESFLTKGNCIAFICDGDGSIGLSVYKKESFIGSTTVKVGRSRYLNKYVGAFIVTVADLGRKRYSFGYKRNEEHLSNERLMLPANSKDEPDYAFMEEYMREVERQQKEKYKAYIQKRIEELGDVEKFENKKWKPFKLIKLFDPNKGNQTDMNSLQDGVVPLVSARKVNNGLKSFVETQNLYQGHCVTLNNDGDGGAGLAYYQPFDFALDSHVTALYPKQELSKHIQVFLSRCISMQEEFFGHGHSINSNRLNSFTIMLPVNSKDEPDYVFMENYMKRKEMEILKRYVDYIKL